MASALSHVAVAIAPAFRQAGLTRRTMALGALCTILPDVDVLGFHGGIDYGALWGHRGLTHSLLLRVAAGRWFDRRPVTDRSR